MDIQVTYHYYICTAPLPIPLSFHQPSGTEDIWAASSFSSAGGGVGCWYVWVCFCMHMSLYLWVCMPACACVFVNTYYVVFLTYNLFHRFSWTAINDVNWQSDISWYNEPIFSFFICLFVLFWDNLHLPRMISALQIHKSPCKLCIYEYWYIYILIINI